MFKQVPDVFVIVFSLILLAAVATWFVPGGAFDRESVDRGGVNAEIVVPGSFHFEQSQPQVLEVFTAPINGLLRLAEIIVFIFLVGGAFFILNETGAIAARHPPAGAALKGREFLVIPR